MTHEKIQLIQEWLHSHSTVKFDKEFLDNVESYYDEHGYLTFGQEKALDNIIKGYKMKSHVRSRLVKRNY